MSQILLKCRIFARMTPNDKIRCVKLHMEKEITGMCGDGGNDCGALRAAHVGLAMSDAEASIVSPFSTKDKSPLAVVTLLKEGRAALATAFSCYKYLLMYGEIIIMSKVIYTYFLVQLSQYVWFMCDAIFVTLLTYALAASKPADRLAKRLPTALLFGPETVISTVGIVVINAIFSMCSMALLFQQPWFVCNEFDSSNIDVTKWWLMADNWEGETLGFVVFYQVFTCAAMNNFGSYFRQAWWKNYQFVLTFLLAWITLTCLLFLDPNPLGCWLRFNCGDPEVLRKELNTNYAYSFTGDKFNNPLGHNVFPSDFRVKLFFYCLGNSAVVTIFFLIVILGPVRECARMKWPLKKRQFSV
eukprot:TRINITY_DN323_c0_g1_i4.p1 TRINITY_DN323_c0_g1~~TRINITY_DN323_c0_g1_i4.p1  ORF type:complete len:357 (+),score=37.39 TRINITY_DN323_c0_g1_i4:286-1356(+)